MLSEGGYKETKMNRLARDENLRNEYGKNGRKAVLRDYDWKVVGETWKQLIKRL